MSSVKKKNVLIINTLFNLDIIIKVYFLYVYTFRKIINIMDIDESCFCLFQEVFILLKQNKHQYDIHLLFSLVCNFTTTLS